MKFTFLFLILGLFFSTTMYSQTAISGRVVAPEFDEELIGAEVRVYKEDVLIHSVQTDIDGNYKVNLEPSIYEVEVSYTGLSKYRKTGIFIEAGRNTTVDFNMKEGPGETIIEKYIKPKIVRCNNEPIYGEYNVESLIPRDLRKRRVISIKKKF